MLKVGELAKHARLSVRTLHHYDEIGLLVPSARSEGGFRLYTQADVMRLHRIQTLKQFGYSLSDIKSVLNNETASPLEILSRQLSVLEEQERKTQALRRRLEWLKSKMTTGAEAEMDDWLTILEMMTMFDRHLSPEQVATLQAIGEAAPTNLDSAWAELVAVTRKAIDQDVPVESEYAQSLGRKWMALLRDTTANDLGLAIKLGELQKSEKRAQEINGITPELMDWTMLAFAHARSALFARYVLPEELLLIRQRLIAHLNDWPPLFVEARSLMDHGAKHLDPAVLDLAQRWEALFHASYAGEDSELEKKVIRAFQNEPELLSGPGVDASIIEFMQNAMEALLVSRANQTPGAAKPLRHATA